MIEVFLGKNENIHPSFPKLMKHRDGTIILFTEHKVGVVLVGGGQTKVGSYSTDWMMQVFEDLNEPVTIKNKV